VGVCVAVAEVVGQGVPLLVLVGVLLGVLLGVAEIFGIIFYFY